MRLDRLIAKAVRDIATSFYDDLEFKEFSSVRLGFYIGLVMLCVTWYQVLFCGKNVEVLIAITGAPLISVIQYMGKKALDNQRRRYEGEGTENEGVFHTE